MASLSLNSAKAIANGLMIAAHTGKITDGATAAGYSLWVESITSTLPKYQTLANQRARVFLDENQKRAMRLWIEAQVKKSMTDKTLPSLETDIGSVIGGAGVKWGVLAGAVAFMAGAVGLKILQGF